MANMDDVPPLDDMSEAMERIITLRGQLGNDTQKLQKPSQSQNISNTPVQSQSTTIDSISSQAEKSNTNKTIEKSSRSSDGEYGGLKKGFLFGSSSGVKQTKKTPPKVLKTDELEIITPKKTTNDDLYRFEEVQQAMRLNESLLQNKDQWLTNDLLTRIQSNPELCQRLMNPETARALADLQTNPEAAMANPATANVVQEFSAILGDHFTSLADKQTASLSADSRNNATSPVLIHSPDGGADMKVVSSTDPRQQREIDDQRRVDALLAQPDIREALMDEDVKRLLAALRADPDQAQKQLHAADASLLAKIRKLIGAGLLKLDR